MKTRMSLIKHLNKTPFNQARLMTQQAASATESASLRDAKPASSIPGLKEWPLVANLPGIIRHGGFDSLDGKKLHFLVQSFFKVFGPTYKLKLPGEAPIVLFSEPEAIEQMFRHTVHHPQRDAFSSLKKIRYDNPSFKNKGGILIENKEAWKRVRSIAQVPMMKPKNLVKYLPQVDQVALEFIERIKTLQENNGGECPENFLEELYKWSLESISLIALDRRLGCFNDDPTAQKIIKVVNELFDSLNATEIGTQWWRLFPTASFRKLKQGHQTLLDLTLESIDKTEKARAELTGEDSRSLTLIQTLLQSEGLERSDVITMILDTLFAGIDTTSHTVGFALYLLAKNPDKQKALQQELDSVLMDGGPEVLSESHLARLQYLKWCIKESLRMYPLTLGTIRTLIEDAIIGGYHIPKGFQVFACSAISGWDEKHFRSANDFIPERWDRKRTFGPIHPFSSLPFSHGPRMCIGRRIAEQEMYTLLARLLHRYNVDYDYEDIKMDFRLVAMPSQPLRFRFTERVK